MLLANASALGAEAVDVEEWEGAGAAAALIEHQSIATTEPQSAHASLLPCRCHRKSCASIDSAHSGVPKAERSVISPRPSRE